MNAKECTAQHSAAGGSVRSAVVVDQARTGAGRVRSSGLIRPRDRLVGFNAIDHLLRPRFLFALDRTSNGAVLNGLERRAAAWSSPLSALSALSAPSAPDTFRQPTSECSA